MSSHSKKLLLPADPLGAHFCQYFHHPWKFITAPVPQVGKPQWRTEIRYPLQPRNLWQKYLDPEKLIGLRFGSTTRYGLLDIDKGSSNHPKRCPGNYRHILEILENIGIVRTLTLQSSDSGGLHIYFFFPKPIPTFALACALQQSLAEEGYWVEDGRLELFPNVKAYNAGQPTNYKAHRLPLQKGSVILDEDLAPFSLSITKFLEIAEVQSTRQNLEQLEQVMAAAEAKHKKSHYHPKRSHRAEQWRSDLETQMKEGWTDKGQTNLLLKVIGTFGRVFKGIKTPKDLAQYIFKKARKLRGFKKHCGHIKDLPSRAQEWAKSLFNFYSPYCSHPMRNGSYKKNLQPKPNKNERRRQEARERIIQAMQYLSQNQTLPETASERAVALQQTAKEQCHMGIGKQTLYKKDNLPLWHPDPQKSKPPKSEQPEPEKDTADALIKPEPPPETPQSPSENDCSDPIPYEGYVLSNTPPAAHEAQNALKVDPQKQEEEDARPPESNPHRNAALKRLALLRAKLHHQAQKRISLDGDLYPGKVSDTAWKRWRTLVKMLTYWQSGEPTLIEEVRQWFQTAVNLTSAEWDLFF